MIPLNSFSIKILSNKYSHITFDHGIYLLGTLKYMHNLKLHFIWNNQAGRRNATEPKAHAMAAWVQSDSVSAPLSTLRFFARARTNNVSAIFERYHDSPRPGYVRVEPRGNNVAGSRKPGRQVQVAVFACVVGHEWCGGGERWLTTFAVLRAALRTFAFCIRHGISRIYVSITKQLETPDDVDGDSTAKALDDLTLIYEWEGGGRNDCGNCADCRQKLKGRHVAAWARGIRRGKRQIKENSVHIKSQSQSPKTLDRKKGAGARCVCGGATRGA